MEGSYEALDVAPQDLEKFATDLKTGTFAGGNVTVPHKEEIIRFCDYVTPTAQKIGAVNTLWVQDGELHGDNTDKYGFLANLDQQLPDWDQRKSTALVLGAGGAARAILVGLAERGYKRILVLNRTLGRAQALCNELNKVFGEGPFHAGRLGDFNSLAPEADLLINTSAVGMNGTRFEDLDLKKLPEHAVVTDIVYTPLETPLLADAHLAGLRTVDGIGMLLHQAVPGFVRWFGMRPDVTNALRNKILGPKS